MDVLIPGTTKLSRLDENIRAAAIELTPDDLHEIESGASKLTVQGAPYPKTYANDGSLKGKSVDEFLKSRSMLKLSRL